MTTTIEHSPNGQSSTVGMPGVPRGPRGLWGALAAVSTPGVVARVLPKVDIALLGPSGGVTMFDYDPALAISLGDELDPETLFS